MVLVLAAGLAACSPAGGSRGPSTRSPTSAAVTSSTPSASPSIMASADASALTERSLLPQDTMTGLGFEEASAPTEGPYKWYGACAGLLPSEERGFAGWAQGWQTEDLYVSQVVDAYPPGIPTDLVEAVVRHLTCSQYLDRDSEYTRVALEDVEPHPDADAQVVWCEERDGTSWRCTSAVAVGPMVDCLEVYGPTKRVTLSVLGLLVDASTTHIAGDASDTAV